MRYRNWFAVGLVVLAGAGVRHCAAEESDAERRAREQAAEATEAENELKSAAENAKMRYENYIGTLKLWAREDPEFPEVLGTFETKDHKYYVKIANESLKETLKPYDTKEVSLIGWSSNKGKYFVVTGVVASTGAAPTPSHKKRGGL